MASAGMARSAACAKEAAAWAEGEVAWLQEVVLGVRRIRAEMDIAPGKPLPLLLQGGDAEDRRREAAFQTYFKPVARLASVDWLADDEEAPEAATALAGPVLARTLFTFTLKHMELSRATLIQQIQPLLDPSRRTLRYAGRAESASPATGSYKRHLEELEEVMEAAFTAGKVVRKRRVRVRKKR